MSAAVSIATKRPVYDSWDDSGGPDRPHFRCFEVLYIVRPAANIFVQLQCSDLRAGGRMFAITCLPKQCWTKNTAVLIGGVVQTETVTGNFL